MIESILNQQSATVRQKVFIRRQYSEPLASGVGSTDVFAMKSAMTQQTAMKKVDVFIRSQYPKPLESNIGKEDLPGGFQREAILSGQHAPLTDLAGGVVQVDDVKVLYRGR